MFFGKEISTAFMLIIPLATMSCRFHKETGTTALSPEVSPATDSPQTIDKVGIEELSLLANPVSANSPALPCPLWTGTLAHPDRGSGMCSGNLLSSIPLPTIDGLLFHNSLKSTSKNGLGNGWNMSFRHQIVRDPSTQIITLTTGDGGVFTYALAGGSTSRWTPTDIRLNRTIITSSGPNLVQSYPGGAQTVFVPSGMANTFSISRSQDLGNQNFINVFRDGTSESWISNYGLVVSLTFSGDKVTSISDSSQGVYLLTYLGDNLTKVTNPDGTFWELEYPLNTSLVGATRSPSGVDSQFAYYAGGVLAARVNHFNLTTNYTYSSSSVTSTNAVGSIAETFANSLITQSVDSSLITSKWSWDSQKRKISSTDNFGRVTTFTYAESNKLPSSIVDPFGSFELTYDSNFNLLSMVEKFGSKSTTSTFTYNAVQNLASTTINGVTETILYDANGNFQGAKLGNDSPLVLTTFDALGRPVQVSSNGLITSATYGQSDIPESITNPFGETLEVNSDSAGRITSMQSPSGVLVTLGYNQIGHQDTQISAPVPGAIDAVAVTNQSSFTVTKSGVSQLNKFIFGQTLVAETEAQLQPWGALKRLQSRMIGTSQSSGLSLTDNSDGIVVDVATGSDGSCKTQPTPINTPLPTPTSTQIPPTPTKAPPTPTPTKTATSTPTSTPTFVSSSSRRSFLVAHTNYFDSSGIHITGANFDKWDGNEIYLSNTSGGTVSASRPPYTLQISSPAPSPSNNDWPTTYTVRSSASGNILSTFVLNNVSHNDDCFNPISGQAFKCALRCVTVDEQYPSHTTVTNGQCPEPPKHCDSVMLVPGSGYVGGPYFNYFIWENDAANETSYLYSYQQSDPSPLSMKNTCGDHTWKFRKVGSASEFRMMFSLDGQPEIAVPSTASGITINYPASSASMSGSAAMEAGSAAYSGNLKRVFSAAVSAGPAGGAAPDAFSESSTGLPVGMPAETPYYITESGYSDPGSTPVVTPYYSPTMISSAEPSSTETPQPSPSSTAEAQSSNDQSNIPEGWTSEPESDPFEPVATPAEPESTPIVPDPTPFVPENTVVPAEYTPGFPDPTLVPTEAYTMVPMETYTMIPPEPTYVTTESFPVPTEMPSPTIWWP